LERYHEAVQLARTTTDYRRGRHELTLGPTLSDTQLYETQQTRTVARLLAADAAIRVHDGDPDGALDSCRAILGVGRSIGDEPFSVSQLVRVSISTMAIKSGRRVLGQAEASDAALARLQSLMLDELAQPLLLIAMKGERAMYFELIRRVGTGEVPISALSEGGPKFDPDAPRETIAPWGKLMFDSQLAIWLEWMNAAVNTARQPAPEHPRLWDVWRGQVERVRRSRLGLYAATLPLLLSPAVTAFGSRFTQLQAELGAAAILLAAERHRRKTGNWPESIAAIAPAILASAPLDPYSGEAFRMESRDGQLFIYSVGPNHVDEHGVYDPTTWLKGGPDDVGVSTC
jgi:hypothetical protein